MFLNLLTNEEKHHFLSLAALAANINGSLAEEEEELINSYRREMNLSAESVAIDSDHSEESVFGFFAASEKSHKKIVLFEVVGLLTCDSSFDDDERSFVCRLSQAIGLSADETDTISQLALRYFDVVVEIASSIFTQ